MKKAVIVGGASGIGGSIASELIKRGYHAVILDRAEPDGPLPSEDYTYIPCDLNGGYEGTVTELASDGEVEVVMLTAGFGRVAELEYLHPAEIRSLMQVNATATIEIIRHFYGRIKSETPFFTGVMSSIAGLVSSPAFSVYAASKAALARFVESVNVEIEASGYRNRILAVCPGSIAGTKFSGGENRPELTERLASEITDRLLSSETVYIPDYDEIYRGVIERYTADPHGFGLESYEYKKAAGRILNEKRVKIGYLSGTFDLFHLGHLNLLKRARANCDYLIVGVHPDASHKAKKTFIPFEERMAVVGGCRYVDRVVESCREDSDAWDRHHYDVLFVGSDYKGTERFRRYEKYFADKGVEIMYFEYTQGTSSTQIREKIIKEALAEVGADGEENR